MWQRLKYLTAFSIPGILFVAMSQRGAWLWAVVIYAFVVLPGLELFLPASPRNFSSEQEEKLRQSSYYVGLLWLGTIVAWSSICLSIYLVVEYDLNWWELMGLAMSCGVVQSVMGLNVAHELGHHKQRKHRLMSHVGLLPSFYLHYYIDHNRGHHKNVATDKDMSSAPMGMSLHRFLLHSAWGTWLSAWRIEAKRLRKLGNKPWGFRNAMWRNKLLYIGVAVSIGAVLGLQALLVVVGSAIVSVLMLESVNYIEHYGLRRKFTEKGRAAHSWSSDHLLGRLVMFEGSRHADHHYYASRPYQVLRHHDDGPQMPTGYPGMMLLAQVPPLWFRVMNPRVIDAQHADARDNRNVTAEANVAADL